MTKDEVEELTKGLTPSDEIKRAVSFLLLVSKNNPAKQWEAISVRTDVQEALAVIHGWVADVRETADRALDETPVPMSMVRRVEVTVPLDTALDNLVEDTSPRNHEEWVKDGKDSYDSKAAAIHLRMNWVVEWLHKVLLWLLGSEKNWKVWVSRRAPNSCSVCVAMHGVTIPWYESFESELLKRGGKPYGGSYTANAHPRCQCKTIPVDDEEAGRGFIPSWGSG